MANIDVVPKRKTNAWLWWIVAAIVIAVILFVLLGGSFGVANEVGELFNAPTIVSASVGTA
jgi:hypothetical protein